MSVPKVRMKWTATKDKRLIKLRTSDLSWEEIGDKFGIAGESARTRYKVLKREQRQDAHPLGDFTYKALEDRIKKHNHKDGMFVVSSIQPTHPGKSPETEWIIGENLHKGFFKAVQNFLKRQEAELVLLPTKAHIKALADQPSAYDPVLLPYLDLMVRDYTFNKYLRASDLGLLPQRQNPLTGNMTLRRGGRRDTSLLIASPKQMLELKSTGNGTSPKLVASTGSMCLPEYQMNPIGNHAREHHVIGALVVTIIGSKFLVHQIQCMNKEGDFVHMGVRYFPDGTVKSERAEAMILGDPHAGEEDEESLKALDATFEMFATLRPKKVFAGDLFNGTSVSHHIRKNLVARASLPDHFSTLDKEIAMCKEYMENIWTYMPEDSEFYLVDSNHHHFLNRFISSGEYTKDIQNWKIGHEIALEMQSGVGNPLKSRLDPDGLYTWLGSMDDLRVEGIQCASHGDRGESGTRGSVKNMAQIHIDSFTGHTHSFQIHYGAYCVATLSKLRHDYNVGPSKWAMGNGVIYKGGARSLLAIIDGCWI